MNRPRQQLIALFSEQSERITKDIDYYISRAWRLHWGSRAILTIALIFFAFGALAPFIELITQNQNIFTWGYGSLVIAGLLIGADRAFLASQGWSRFILTQLQLEELRNKLALEQRKFEITVSDDEAAKGRVEDIIDLLRKHEEVRASIVEAETKVWASELAAAIADLEKRIATATAEAPKAHAERSASAAEPGAISVRFTDTPKDASRIIVSVGGVSRDMSAAPAKLVFENQSPGPRAVRVRWAKGDAWREIEEAIDVKPGEIADVKISFPPD